MAKIAYIIPGKGLKESEVVRRRKIANDIMRGLASVEVITVREGPDSIESAVEEAMASVSYLPEVIRMKDHYDAFVIGCFGDPGLRASRELIKKPVIGPAQASLHVISQLAEKFTIVTPLKTTIGITREVVKLYGFSDRVSSIYVAESSISDINRDPDNLVKRLIDDLKLEIDRTGSEGILLGCMSMGFSLIDEKIRESLGVPVVNPVKVSLGMAYIFSTFSLSHSRRTYPEPNYEKVIREINEW
jgi:allantoin racemase